MNLIAREGTALFIYLRERAAYWTQCLIDMGYYDLTREGPDTGKIEDAVKPFLGLEKHSELPDKKLDWLIEHGAIQAGTAFQGLGNPDIASLWYQIGQYVWRGNAPWHHENLTDLELYVRMGSSPRQENAAICAALSGALPHAEKLFGWIVQDRTVTGAEIQYFEEARDYYTLGTNLGYLIFALMWLGNQWEEVARLSEIGRRMIEKGKKDDFSSDFSTPKLLIGMGGPISAYFLNPNPTHREMASNVLRLDNIPHHESIQRLIMLRYLFALIHRYPEISPYPEAAFQLRMWRPSMSQRDIPPTKNEIQNALDEIFSQAAQHSKWCIDVTSTDLHIRAGGYPAKNHQLKQCCEVMLENVKYSGGRTGEKKIPEDGIMTVRYDVHNLYSIS